jgi:hypothetical protein
MVIDDVADEAAEKGISQILFEWADGSQVIVDVFDTGEIQAARREHNGAIWGPPADGERVLYGTS